MLRDEIAKYTELSGNDGEHTPICVIGAYLDGYDKGLELSASKNPNKCGDLISRQAVENITWEEPSYTDPLNVLTEVREKVRALPSVENKGEWIVACYQNLKCSNCNHIIADSDIEEYNFCPNCGADMRKAEKPETCKGCLEPCIMYEPNMRGCKKKVTESED